MVSFLHMSRSPASTRLPSVPSSLRSLTALVLLALGSHLANAKATCYGLRGKENPGSSPCNGTATGTTGSHSTCCSATNKDACLSTNLCLNTIATTPGNVLWATGCTDPTLKDPSCPKICVGDKYGQGGNYFLRSCDSNSTTNSWCCGEEGQTLAGCCANKFQMPETIGTVVKQFGFDLALAESSMSTQPTASITAQTSSSSHRIPSPSSSSSATTPTNSPTPEQPSSTALIAGLAATSIIGGLALWALTVAVLYIWRLRRRIRALGGANNTATQPAHPDPGAPPQRGFPPYPLVQQSFQSYVSPTSDTLSPAASFGIGRKPELFGSEVGELYAGGAANWRAVEMPTAEPRDRRVKYLGSTPVTPR